MPHKTIKNYVRHLNHPKHNLNNSIEELRDTLTLYSIEYLGRIAHDSPDAKRLAEIKSDYQLADEEFKRLAGHSFSEEKRKRIAHHPRRRH